MSLNIKKSDGSLQKVAGNTVILDATTSEVRSGTFSLSGGPSWVAQNITFTTPMPDTNYIVNVELASATNTVDTPFRIINKTVNGFNLAIYVASGGIAYTGTYYAIRLVELEGYTELQNKVNNPDSAPTENSTNLVTSGGVYEAIQNATKVFIGTEQEWEDETDKTKYQLAVLTDKTQINSVDETTGDTEVVADRVQYTTLPTASAQLEDLVVQYTGSTTNDYKEGGFYKCVETSTPGTYEWVVVFEPQGKYINAIAVDEIAHADLTNVGKYYYDVSDNKFYVIIEDSGVASAYEDTDIVVDKIEITNELYQSLSSAQKNYDYTWFVVDVEAYEPEYHNFTVLTTDWVANTDTTTNTDYPYVAVISTIYYEDGSHPLWQMNGSGIIPTAAEQTEIDKIMEAYFTSTNITLYATKKPVVSLVLEVRD